MEHQDRRFQDWANLLIGLGIALYPWVSGYANDETAKRVSFISGLLIFLVAGAALIRFAEWEEWLNALLGLCVAATPFAFNLTGNNMATQTLFVGGILVAALSLWELWIVRHPEPREPMLH